MWFWLRRCLKPASASKTTPATFKPCSATPAATSCRTPSCNHLAGCAAACRVTSGAPAMAPRSAMVRRWSTSWKPASSNLPSNWCGCTWSTLPQPARMLRATCAGGLNWAPIRTGWRRTTGTPWQNCSAAKVMQCSGLIWLAAKPAPNWSTCSTKTAPKRSPKKLPPWLQRRHQRQTSSNCLSSASG